jgi:hypothetical protein
VEKGFYISGGTGKSLGTTTIGHMYSDSTDMTSPHSYDKKVYFGSSYDLSHICLWHHFLFFFIVIFVIIIIIIISSKSRFGPVTHTEGDPISADTPTYLLTYLATVIFIFIYIWKLQTPVNPQLGGPGLIGPIDLFGIYLPRVNTSTSLSLLSHWIILLTMLRWESIQGPTSLCVCVCTHMYLLLTSVCTGSLVPLWSIPVPRSK